jgi:hypothetical protein
VTTAVAATIAALACFDTLLIHALHVDVRHCAPSVRLIAELPDRIEMSQRVLSAATLQKQHSRTQHAQRSSSLAVP